MVILLALGAGCASQNPAQQAAAARRAEVKEPRGLPPNWEHAGEAITPASQLRSKD
jgi:hypothetical protein